MSLQSSCLKSAVRPQGLKKTLLLVRTFQSVAADEPRPIYVAATRQHVGKTSCSLALLSGLQKRVENVGFIKPVGQQSVLVKEDGEVHSVDKDAALVKKHFKLDHISYRHMSPVLIPPGYTKDYVDGKISNESQQELVQGAYREVADRSSVVLCEGTGHCAVGSIVNASNARVASWLGAAMVLVANGGLGKAFDELELNRILCSNHDVPIAGVIINKVHVEKYDQTKYYIEKALHENWGVPLIGCIPDRPFLGCPALADLERLLSGSFISGQAHALMHYTIADLNLVATSLPVFLESLRTRASRTLYVCHASRDDILLGFLAEHQRRRHRGIPFEAALIVCDGDELDPQVLDMLALDSDPPILVVPKATSHVMETIRAFTPKLNADDTSRVAAAVDHYEPYIDFDLLMQRTGNTAALLTESKNRVA